MIIEITKAGSRGFCEEVTYIRTNYVRVHNNPGRPAKTITNYMGIRIIGFFIVANCSSSLFIVVTMSIVHVYLLFRLHHILGIILNWHA